MKALTLTQPWAWLICTGRKSFETRSWRTHYRGPLAIHAAATLNANAQAYARDRNIDPNVLPRGQIVATATLLDCIPTDAIRDELSAQERDAGDYSDGRWAWKLGNIQVLPQPIAAKGALGLWLWNAQNCGTGVPPATVPDRRGQKRTRPVPPASSRQGLLRNKRTIADI